MAFTVVITGRAVVGNEVMTWGTFLDLTAGTAANMNMGIRQVSKVFLQPTGAAVAANAPAVNETFTAANPTIDGTSVSCITDSDQAGIWVAWGDQFA